MTFSTRKVFFYIRNIFVLQVPLNPGVFLLRKITKLQVIRFLIMRWFIKR